MGYFGSVHRTFKYASVLSLFLVGAVPITAVFYEMFVHLPPYTSILWKGILGASFTIAAIGLLIGWLIFLSFRVLLNG